MYKNILLCLGIIITCHTFSLAQQGRDTITTEQAPHCYSHWTTGFALGEPFIFCNLTSFATNKTYWGISAGLFGGYQFNPIFGLQLSLDYGSNKAGAHSYAFERKLGPDGTTYYLPTLPGTSFTEIESRIHFISVGLQPGFNMNRILFHTPKAQKFTILLLPTFYLQHYKAKVCNKQGQEITDGSLNKSLSLGLGGEIALRARINAMFDAQLSSGIIWTNNNTFDGIKNMSNAKDDYIWNTKVSLIYKINRKSKGEQDNILYEPWNLNKISADLEKTLARAKEKEEQLEQQQMALQAQLQLLYQRPDSINLPDRRVDTLYIIQKEIMQTPPENKALRGEEDWVLRLIQKIEDEQPEVVEREGYKNLVEQVKEAKEIYADYYTDAKMPEEPSDHQIHKYAIQIYAMSNPFPSSFFKGSANIRVVRLIQDGLYRYLYAVYDSMEEARKALPEVRSKYWDAFIREFDDYMIKNSLLLDLSTEKKRKAKKVTR